MTYLDEAVEIGVQMVSGLLTPASLTDIYVMIARKHEIPPQKVESSIRSAICEINKEMGMHFTPHDLYSHSSSWRKIPKEDDES